MCIKKTKPFHFTMHHIQNLALVNYFFLPRIYGRKFNEKPRFLGENRLAFTAILQSG